MPNFSLLDYLSDCQRLSEFINRRHNTKTAASTIIDVVKECLKLILFSSTIFWLKKKMLVDLIADQKVNSTYVEGNNKCIHCMKSVQIRSFLWSVFSRIRSKSPYSVRMRENADQKKFRIWTLFT